jgi:hypothetical protein
MRRSKLEHEAWCTLAYAVVAQLCRRRAEFYSDDVWDRLDGETLRPKDKRALGPIMLRAQNEKLCAPALRVRRVRRCHGHWRVVWRSLVYRERRAA